MTQLADAEDLVARLFGVPNWIFWPPERIRHHRVRLSRMHSEYRRRRR
jgi:hypothetical protein